MLLARFKLDIDFLASLELGTASSPPVPDWSARFPFINLFWSLREPRTQSTKCESDGVGLPQQALVAGAEGYA